MSRPCTECGGTTHIFNTRYLKTKNMVWRRYTCKSRQCGAVFSTYELPADQLKQLAAPTRTLLFSFMGFYVYELDPPESNTKYWLQRENGEGMGIGKIELLKHLERGWSEIF
jgi:hypothetical protein